MRKEDSWSRSTGHAPPLSRNVRTDAQSTAVMSSSNISVTVCVITVNEMTQNWRQLRTVQAEVCENRVSSVITATRRQIKRGLRVFCTTSRRDVGPTYRKCKGGGVMPSGSEADHLSICRGSECMEHIPPRADNFVVTWYFREHRRICVLSTSKSGYVDMTAVVGNVTLMSLEALWAVGGHG